MSRFDVSVTSRWGYFIGAVRSEWITEDGPDRRMRLLRRITFVDPERRRWVAPCGLIFDGASVPRPLWSIVGSPFNDDYRRAAVIHDAIYQSQECLKDGWPYFVSRDEADWAFYCAMRADGMGAIKANIIYRAVRLFGRIPWHNKRREE